MVVTQRNLWTECKCTSIDSVCQICLKINVDSQPVVFLSFFFFFLHGCSHWLHMIWMFSGIRLLLSPKVSVIFLEKKMCHFSLDDLIHHFYCTFLYLENRYSPFAELFFFFLLSVPHATGSYSIHTKAFNCLCTTLLWQQILPQWTDKQKWVHIQILCIISSIMESQCFFQGSCNSCGIHSWWIVNSSMKYMGLPNLHCTRVASKLTQTIS